MNGNKKEEGIARVRGVGFSSENIRWEEDLHSRFMERHAYLYGIGYSREEWDPTGKVTIKIDPSQIKKLDAYKDGEDPFSGVRTHEE